MPQLIRPAFKDPHYGLERQNGSTLYIQAAGPGTPTALTLPAAGYAPSCIFQNTSGTIGTLVYVNTGTSTAATWTNIL